MQAPNSIWIDKIKFLMYIISCAVTFLCPLRQAIAGVGGVQE